MESNHSILCDMHLSGLHGYSVKIKVISASKFKDMTERAKTWTNMAQTWTKSSSKYLITLTEFWALAQVIG